MQMVQYRPWRQMYKRGIQHIIVKLGEGWGCVVSIKLRRFYPRGSGHRTKWIGSSVDPSTGFDNRSALAGQDTNRCHVLWTEPRVVLFLARGIFTVQTVTPRVPLNPCFSIYCRSRKPNICRITDKPLPVHNLSSMKLKTRTCLYSMYITCNKSTANLNLLV
jgi:hypothetical protein